MLIVLSDQSLHVTFPVANHRRLTMRIIDTIYIDGQFVAPHGEELFDLFNPATEEKIGQVRLGDAVDAKAAVAAAKRAFSAFCWSAYFRSLPRTLPVSFFRRSG